MTRCERFVNSLLEAEKEGLLDYLFGCCDDPLSSASEDLEELFDDHNITDEQDIRTILQESHVRSYFPGGVPGDTDLSVWFPLGEIETTAGDIPSGCEYDFTISGNYAYYYVGYGLMIEFSKKKIVESMCDLSYPVKGFYNVAYYHDVWRYDDQWQVNDLSRVRDNVHIDLDTMTDRELYCIFAEAAGLNKRLRSIDVVVSDESFIEFYYTAHNDYYPLGRFELNVI